MIAFGDYAQLGSLDGASDGDEDAYIVPAHGDVEPTVCDSSSVFSADVFTTATFLPHIATVVLERNFRQSETDPLLGLLDHMRVGRVDLADWHLIQNLKVPSDKVDRDKILTMCTTVKVREEEQRRYKEQKLADGSEARTYIATRSILVNSRDVKKKLRASKITIFKGARVRYTSNELKLTDKKARLFNGLFGRVIEFRRDAVVVEFDNGVTAEINPTLVEVLGDKINVRLYFSFFEHFTKKTNLFFFGGGAGQARGTKAREAAQSAGLGYSDPLGTLWRRHGTERTGHDHSQRRGGYPLAHIAPTSRRICRRVARPGA